MTTRSDWENSVLKSAGASSLSELEVPLGAESTYPLLGDDAGAAGALETFEWRVRLVIRDSFDQEQLSSLKDPGTDVVAWTEQSEQPLSSILQATRHQNEGRIRVDLQILKNLTQIRELRTSKPEIETWVLVSEGADNDDPETLVGETIRILTGILAGCRVLEIRQAEGESYHSLFSRLNVARLLQYESQLNRFSDPVEGAGFFAELAQRLSSSL